MELTGDELRQRLRAISTAAICDANKGEARELRVMDPGIRPLVAGTKFVGRAHTVSCFEDFLTVIKGLGEAAAGDVLVVDTRGSRRAVAGGLFPLEARRKQLAAIVIDGPCRDTADIRALGFPYYARSSNCQAGTTARLFETQVAVSCGGVTVHPGDLLFGDDDGIVVATHDEFAALLDRAEAIAATEERLMQRMAGGDSLLAMMNFGAHCAELAAGRPSKLTFNP